MSTYLSLVRQSAAIRARLAQPIEFAGEMWYPTVIAAARIGRSRSWLNALTKDVPGDNVILMSHGMRFVRVPRAKNDLRAPIYWSLK